MHSLEARRITTSLLFLYDVVRDSTTDPEQLSKINLQVPRANSRTGHTFCPPCARTGILENSIISKVMEQYNRLCANKPDLDMFYQFRNDFHRGTYILPVVLRTLFSFCCRQREVPPSILFWSLSYLCAAAKREFYS